MVGSGFEPLKAEPADLQSAPIGHSGNPPKHQQCLQDYINLLLVGNRALIGSLLLEATALKRSESRAIDCSSKGVIPGGQTFDLNSL